MITAFECYKEYMALKNHFSNQSYDYFKYQGKIKLTSASFEKRKDKVFFQKLAKHSDVHNFLVANFSVNDKAWIKDLAYGENAERIYKDWVKRQQSLTYVFKNDLGKLQINFDDNFICSENEHPYLLKLYLANQISIESLCLLLELSGAKRYWDKKLAYDLIWDDTRVKVEKYSPFIQADKENLKKIVIDYFS